MSAQVVAAWTDEQREAHIREHPSPPGPADVPFLLRLLDAERARVERVEAFAARLVADGYSTCIYESAAEMGEIIHAAIEETA